MKIRNSIIVVCLTLSAAFVGAVDWNRPELPAEDLKAIKVVAPAAAPVPEKHRVPVKVPLMVLKFQPRNYVGKTVMTEAVLENSCPSYFKPCFVLQTGRGTRSFVAVPVAAWLPLHIMFPIGHMKRPVMLDVLGKKLVLIGKLELVGVPSKKQGGYTYRFKVSKYEIKKK
mgnify:CR=1 FL=1